MGTTDQFTRAEVQRILELTPRQLEQWDRLRLLSSRKEEADGERSFDFRDLIGLRTVKQLIESGVPVNRLGRAVAALRERLSHVDEPLTELRILSDGRDVIVERDGARLEPVSGQFVLNFETRELHERVRAISTGFSADAWFRQALQCEENRKFDEAIHAYEQVLHQDSARVDALLNCGTLYYEQGNLEKAAEYFERAAVAEPQNALAHSNLGSVLEELGEPEKARQHLRLAVRLDPARPDARFNLALVCEKLSALPEAREHWQSYIKLDPAGPCSEYARQRLAAAPKAQSAHS